MQYKAREFPGEKQLPNHKQLSTAPKTYDMTWISSVSPYWLHWYLIFIYGNEPLHSNLWTEKNENNTHLSSFLLFFFFQKSYVLHMYKYSPIERYCLPPVMDQADTQTCQNHHFGVCFPPPHFQVSANHYKSMTRTEEIIVSYPIRIHWCLT